MRSELGRDGFVSRYSTARPTTAWPATRASSGLLVLARERARPERRRDEARALFERLLGLANDLGLLAEEHDVGRGRQVGNFPQAFSHLGLIQAASLLWRSAAQIQPRRLKSR